MNLAEVILSVVAALIGIGIWTLYGYVKKLPDRLHQYGLTKSEYRLKADLEGTKTELLRELEISKISRAEIQIHKTKEFIEFTNYFNDMLSHPEKQSQITRDPKKLATFKRRMLDLGVRLYFFGSDETIQTYLDFRRLGSGEQTAETRKTLLETYGRLMVEMRRDLGHVDTACTADDFLRLIITDWDQYKLGSS